MTTSTRILALVLTLLATTSFAQTGAKGVFHVHNATESHTVVAFYTSDGGDWSSNWLTQALEPGDAAAAEFIADTGTCQQFLMVGWLGEDNSEVRDDPISIDICKASNVYLGDNEIYFD